MTHITASWPDLLRRPITATAERDRIEAEVGRLSRPAPREWTLARIAALLSGYYASDIPASIVRIEAEDWAEALSEYPEWAITAACRWWKGEGNTNRRKKPLEGDIAARCRHEMGVVFVARTAVQMFDEGRKPFVPVEAEPRPVMTADQRQAIANEVLAKAGFAPRKMGGAQ